MQNSIKTHSVAETKNFAKEFLNNLKDSKVIALVGDLGAGKTTFVQGLGSALGITRMTSPTYTIVRQYKISHPKFKELYHLDLYRLGSSEEVEALGLGEILADPEALVLIEWPEKILDKLPENYLTVRISTIDDETRQIDVL